MSFSPDHSCLSSKKESLAGVESNLGDEHLRNERMMPPPLTGRGGGPRTILDSYGTLAFGLPPNHAIHQDKICEMPPAILNEKGEVAATEPEHNDGNDTDTTLTDRSKIYVVAGSVLESTFGDQARAGDALTDTILHRRQQRYSVAGRQYQQETTNVMDHQADTTPVRRTTHSGTPFSPRRGDDVSLARLKNVEQNDDSLASGSLYHRSDDNVDDNEGSGDVNVVPGDSSIITSVVG
jgi:hypothetical protein